jgi:hypothetical protein
MTTIDDDVLASRTRRRVLAMLAAADEVSFETLAARLSAADGGSGPTAREYATHLHHVDLPRLAEAGYVTWNWAGGEVAATEAGRQVVDERSLQAPSVSSWATDAGRSDGVSATGLAAEGMSATGSTGDHEIAEDGYGDD